MIHVALGFDDPFAKFAGTTIISMFENISQPPPVVTVHILHDNTLTQENRDKFIYLAGRYNQIIKFYNVEEKFIKELNFFLSVFSPNALKRFSMLSAFRLLIGKIIPAEIVKIIYLDSDVLVNLNINELWTIELGNNVIAAVPEHDEPAVGFAICRDGFVKPENYFNSGVMIINLEKMRSEEKKILEATKFIAARQYGLLNQNIFNYCFSERTVKLPRKFNVWVREQPRFNNTPIERKIYHYIGKSNSLGLDIRDKYNRLYWQYFCKTPWFNEETIGKIAYGVKDLYAERQNLLIKISAIISGRRRAFVTIPPNVDALKKIFYVNESEDIFQINSQDWLPKLINTMKESSGRKLFIILVGRIYSQLRAILTRIGFAEERDFINGEIFLSEMHGVPLNLYPLIEKM